MKTKFQKACFKINNLKKDNCFKSLFILFKQRFCEVLIITLAKLGKNNMNMRNIKREQILETPEKTIKNRSYGLFSMIKNSVIPK